MPVEAATWINQLDPTKPNGATDDIAEGDDHFRKIKEVLQNQFPSLGMAAVSVTAAQLNDVVNKASPSGQTYTGTHTFSGATVVFGTPTFGTPTLAAHAATKAYADALPFVSASGATYTGTHNFSAATVSFGTPTFGTPSLATHAATKAYADSLAFGATGLPGVSAATANKSLINDGVTASWGEPPLTARSLYFATMG